MTVEDEFADGKQWLWNEQEALQDRCLFSASYHGKRERFFSVWERLLQALTAIAATSAFADITGKDNGASRWLALTAAIASIFPLVFGFADRARLHGQLKAGFKSLLARMYAAGIEWDDANLIAFRAQLAELEAGEPASLSALVIHCQNEIATSRKQRCYPLSWWEWLFMHFYGFDGAKIVARTGEPVTRAIVKTGSSA
ncbi:hypothetical protein BH10PSE18_BH10PSE18_18910 [soil metagenome]